VAKKIKVSESVDGGGYRSLVNVGKNGGQEVPHLHFHVFGGEKIGKMVS
jgi:histidine triad (HIT) family protein